MTSYNEIAANILQAAVNTNAAPKEFVVASAVSVISGALLEAAVIGACVFVLKALLSNFGENGALWYSIGSRKILSAHITTVGILIGTILVTVISKMAYQLQGVLYSVSGIGLVLVGVAVMWNQGNAAKRTQQKRAMHISNLLIGVLLNMVVAVLCAIIMTSCMLGGMLIRNGLPFVKFLQFFAAECVAYFAMCIVCYILKK